MNLLQTEHFIDDSSRKYFDALVASVDISPIVTVAIDTQREFKIKMMLHQDLGRTAQQLDMYYSNLVHGAAVKIPLGEIWCPNNELEHLDRDTNKFFHVMWGGLKEMLTQAVSNSAAVSSRGMVEYTYALFKSIQSVRDIKRHMKEIWEESKSYRISDRVHMTEVQILQRLKMDGVFEWLDAELDGGKSKAQNLHICFFMRR